MTVPVDRDAAHASHDEPADAGQRDGTLHSQRKKVSERFLAGLEAQLARELRDSPTIAGSDEEEESPPQDAAMRQETPPARPPAAPAESQPPRPVRRPIRRAPQREAPAVRRRPQEDPPKPAGKNEGQRVDDLLRALSRLSAADTAPAPEPSTHSRETENPGEPARPFVAPSPRLRMDERNRSDEDELRRALAEFDDRYDPVFTNEPARVREPEMPRAVPFRQGRAPLGAPPWADRPSPFARAMRVAAAIFSTIALVGASAAVFMLVVGGERPEMQAAADAKQAERPTVAALRASGNDRASDAVPAASQARDEAPAVTGSLGTKLDTSRIPSPSEASPPVRAGGTVRPAAEVPMGGPYVATQTAETTVAPRADVPAVPSAPAATAAAPRALPTFGTPPTAVPRVDEAPVETAATQTGGGAGAGPAADAARVTRNAAVTKYVNMRTEPKNESAVVLVVPEGREVGVVNCEQWCQVVYDGREGFIHKRFVAGMEQ